MAGNLEVGLRLPACGSLRTLQDFSARAEDAGIGALWLPDSQLLWRDTYAALAAIALATSRIGLGTPVSNDVPPESTSSSACMRGPPTMWPVTHA